MRFEVCKVLRIGARPRWRWQLTGSGGAVVAYGEGYRSKRDCESAIKSVMAADVNTPVEYSGKP